MNDDIAVIYRRLRELEAKVAELQALLDLHIEGTNRALEANHRLGIAAFNA